MKNILITTILSIFCLGLYAQDKEKLKELEKRGFTLLDHKKIYNGKDWTMAKIAVIYKLTTASSDFQNYKSGSVKGQTSTGAYAQLSGITEQDLQNITEKVAAQFKEKWKAGTGIEIKTYDTWKGSKAEQGYIDKAEGTDREIFLKHEGIAYATTADNSPYYQRVGGTNKIGKKLAKQQGTNAAELTIIIDFAQFIVDANAGVSKSYGSSYTTYTVNKKGSSKILPVIHIVPTPAGVSGGGVDRGSALKDMGVGTTSFAANDDIGYYYIGGGIGHSADDNCSYLEYAEDVVLNEGQIPAVLANRKNKKMDFAFTYDVTTNAEKYEAAVLDVTAKYFDNQVLLYQAADRSKKKK